MFIKLVFKLFSFPLEGNCLDKELICQCNMKENNTSDGINYNGLTESIFRTLPLGIISPYSDIFRTVCNLCICRNQAYWQSWIIQNPSIIASWCILRTLSYLWKFLNIQNSDIYKTWHIFRKNHLKDLRWSFLEK